jgi:hypothetical protein
MSYRSNPFRKDNPRWAIGNAPETTKVPSVSSPLLTTVVTTWDLPGTNPLSTRERVQSLGGIALSWLIGLPRRTGTRLYAMNDQEAGWHGWQITETWGGLGRQYRDARFDLLRLDPTIRRVELREDPAQPDWPCGGGL